MHARACAIRLFTAGQARGRASERRLEVPEDRFDDGQKCPPGCVGRGPARRLRRNRGASPCVPTVMASRAYEERSRGPAGRAALLAVLLLALLAAPAPAQALDRGISDSDDTTFAEPFWSGLHVGLARAVLPWDVALPQAANDPRKLEFDRYVASAHAHGVTPMVAFEASPRLKASDGGPMAPTLAQFDAAFQAFRRAYPTSPASLPGTSRTARTRRSTRCGQTLGSPRATGSPPRPTARSAPCSPETSPASSTTTPTSTATRPRSATRAPRCERSMPTAT